MEKLTGLNVTQVNVHVQELRWLTNRRQSNGTAVGADLKQFVAGAPLENSKVINAMNTFPVPDGDTGTNMCLTMRSALNEVLKVNEILYLLWVML